MQRVQNLSTSSKFRASLLLFICFRLDMRWSIDDLKLSAHRTVLSNEKTLEENKTTSKNCTSRSCLEAKARLKRENEKLRKEVYFGFFKSELSSFQWCLEKLSTREQ